MKVAMLTTNDNPYNPFEQFDSWLMFDKQHQYNCCERVDRIANINETMSETEVIEETNRAIDEIIQYDVLNIYKKVTDNAKIL